MEIIENGDTWLLLAEPGHGPFDPDDDIIGVYSTREKAEAAMRQIEKMREEEERDERIANGPFGAGA